MHIEIEEKVHYYKELSLKISELEEEKKNLSLEIRSLMPQDVKTLVLGDCQVKKHTRITIKTSVEEARAFDAVRIEEVVDKDKLKKLSLLGQPVPGVSTSEYILVSKLTADSNVEGE